MFVWKKTWLIFIKFIIINLKILVSESKDFRDVEIDDDLLENILEFPTKAFEISKDKFTHKKKLALKGNYSNLNYSNWDYETEIKLQGRIQPNMKKNKPLRKFICLLINKLYLWIGISGLKVNFFKRLFS